MPYLNDSSVIIHAYTSVYFRPMKTAKERTQIEPWSPVTSRVTKSPNMFNWQGPPGYGMADGEWEQLSCERGCRALFRPSTMA
jgi:hypothetical protein